jgi:hypothetical protein
MSISIQRLRLCIVTIFVEIDLFGKTGSNDMNLDMFQLMNGVGLDVYR